MGSREPPQGQHRFALSHVPQPERWFLIVLSAHSFSLDFHICFSFEGLLFFNGGGYFQAMLRELGGHSPWYLASQIGWPVRGPYRVLFGDGGTLGELEACASALCMVSPAPFLCVFRKETPRSLPHLLSYKPRPQKLAASKAQPDPPAPRPRLTVFHFLGFGTW